MPFKKTHKKIKGTVQGSMTPTECTAAAKSGSFLPGPLLIIYRGESSNICLDSVSKSTPCLLPPDLPLCILSRAWSHLGQLYSSSWAVLFSRLSNGLSFSPRPALPAPGPLAGPVPFWHCLFAASPAHAAPDALAPVPEERTRVASLTCWLTQPRKLLACPAAGAHRCHVCCLSLRPSDNIVA